MDGTPGGELTEYAAAEREPPAIRHELIRLNGLLCRVTPGKRRIEGGGKGRGGGARHAGFHLDEVQRD
jgi:hypothetical protein